MRKLLSVGALLAASTLTFLQPAVARDRDRVVVVQEHPYYHHMRWHHHHYYRHYDYRYYRR